MICGFLGCASGEGNPVISTLPALLKLNVEQAGAAEWIRSTFRYAAEEVSAGRPGSGTVLAKLSELLFVEAVRRYAETLPEGQTGWLAGLRETHVARALALLHGDITRRWTVDDLSREVGLSRSALADRFIHLIGVPPMHYLASWRMQVATQKLRDTSASLAQVAQMVGYNSEGRFLPRIQKGIWCAASDMATFEQLGIPIDKSPRADALGKLVVECARAGRGQRRPSSSGISKSSQPGTSATSENGLPYGLVASMPIDEAVRNGRGLVGSSIEGSEGPAGI